MIKPELTVFTMKTNRFSIIFALIPLVFLCYCHMENRHVSDTPLPPAATAVPAEHIAPQNAESADLKLYASGACLMDADSCRVLYGKNESAPLPMASTTKIMTCLLALENGNLDDTVTFSTRAASMPKVHLRAPAKSEFRLEDLLYSLMLESHNDTAVAIAEHIGGSVEGFAAMMNAKAAELGMTQTNFVTPNGLDADGHASTPADMCRLAAYACKNETFLHIVQTASKTIHDVTGKHTWTLSNKDAFLTSYDGALGIKTGFTGKAGFCFVGAARRDSRTFTSCVLASGWPPNKSYKWADTKSLMNFGFKNYAVQNIPIQDLSSVQIAVTDGKADHVGITSPEVPAFLLSPYDTVDIEYQLPSSLPAPVRKDTAAGTVQICINGTLAGSFPVYPDNNVEKKLFSDICEEIIRLFCSF